MAPGPDSDIPPTTRPTVPGSRWRRYVSFSPRHQPYMTRQSYRHELSASLTFPLAVALAEGAFTGVVAAKYFDASKTLIAVITAAPMFGNIAATFWAELSHGRPKVAFANRLQLACVACIAAVALTRFLPAGEGGGVAGWTFATLIVLSRVLASGIVTARGAIWRYNYPHHVRGQIISRLTVASTFALGTMTTLGAVWLEANPAGYVFLYPLAAAISLYGVRAYARVRVRGEPAMLRDRADSLGTTGPDSAPGARPRSAWRRVRRLWGESWQVLREDHLFRDYQRLQMLMGISFMMIAPVLVSMVSREMTDPLRDYLLAVLVLQVVPLVTASVFTQVWAPAFDTRDIFSFRVLHGFVSTSAHTLTAAGALLDQFWLIAVAAVALGVSNGGGNLAWNLGQNDFAPREKVATYMGVHVMLTGLRGCFAPFVGVLLYGGAFGVPGIGRWTFAVAAGLCATSWVGYLLMSRRHSGELRRRRMSGF